MVPAYVRDPAEIYRRSFAIVEGEADLSGLEGSMRDVAIRLIHSCGMVNILDDLACSEGAADAGKQALLDGKSVFCDVEMVRSGIIKRLLPADNALICTLNDGGIREHAKAIGNTRSAAGVDRWNGQALDGAIAVIGNAPTALFRLMERIEEGVPAPALIIGIPVGFVGAVESKAALADSGLPHIVVHGRRGGSAMASAVVNALAGGLA